MRFLRSPRLALLSGMAILLAAGSVYSLQRSSGRMASAATAFVNSLTPEQKQKGMFPFESDERLHWNFIPTENFPRNGLLVRDMTPAQRDRAHDLLKAALSQRGYLTATAIMELESTLGALERSTGRGAQERDPVKYFFSIF